MMKKSSITASVMMLLFSIFSHAAALKTGPWRFEMRATHGTVPFIIEFKRDKKGYKGILKNGKEEIKLNDITVKEDSLSIPLQTYEMSLEMDTPKDGTMTGFLIRHNKNPVVKTPVFAVHGITERFPQKKSEPAVDLTGKWAVTIIDDEMDKKDKGVLVFEQEGNKLHGSLLTPTGDYRYMEGYVSGHDFEAASFDGVYNYVVKGNVKDKKLQGQVLTTYKLKLEGQKDENAELPDAYKQTQVEEKLKFEFPDLSGKKVSLDDPKFKGKPVVVQFFGSWCPNCLDEMNFLIPWYKENNKRGIEVVALAFERSLGAEEAKRQLQKTKKKKGVPYPILIAGSTAQDKPADKIKGLKNFISFPTTVFLNKNHEVVKVHAGFTGPSTGKYYEKWKEDFNNTVNELLK